MKIKKVHPLQWLLDPLEGQPTFLQKKMFGCEAAYLRGRLMLVLADGKEPWNGLLICTDREHHSSLQKQFPSLDQHEILGKWLYLSQSDPSFESIASSIVELTCSGDERIGVESKPRRRITMKKREPNPKRKPAQAFDRSRRVPLKEVINFGPVILPEFEAIGITTLDQLENLGFEEVARRWVEHFPERLNVNAFIGIIATIDGISWTQVNANQKARARVLVNAIRRELHLPSVKAIKKK